MSKENYKRFIVFAEKGAAIPYASAILHEADTLKEAEDAAFDFSAKYHCDVLIYERFAMVISKTEIQREQ